MEDNDKQITQGVLFGTICIEKIQIGFNTNSEIREAVEDNSEHYFKPLKAKCDVQSRIDYLKVRSELKSIRGRSLRVRLTV